MPQVASKPPWMAGPSAVWDTPRNTYSLARATLADSAQARGAGAGASLMLPRRAMPSARAVPATSTAASADAAPRPAVLEMLKVMVASLLIRPVSVIVHEAARTQSEMAPKQLLWRGACR